MKTIKVKNWYDIPKGFSGIAELLVGTKGWFLNGERHRVDGPAVEYANRTKQWYLNGKQHRVDGPAIEYPDGEKFWFLNDEYHRLDGPAVEYANGVKSYWIHGKHIKDETAYWLLANMMRLKGLL